MKVYNQADGLPFSAIRTCGRDADGNVWFAQQKILARLSPETEATTAPPPIYVGDVRVNGKTIAKLSELGETEIGELSLNSDQKQIEISFFGLGFAAGERLLYQYKLEGSGGDWSTPSAQRALSLSLSPGTYRFLVRAVNADGLVSERPAIVTFTIARPIWQRWWFLLIAALVLAGIVYAIYRYRLRRMVELERVRTRIATDLHDDIGSSLSQIAILSEVVRQRTGENGTSEPLNVIANTSREMVDSMSDIVWAINPQKDHLSDLAHRMRRFASDLLDATEIAYRFELPGMGIDVPLGADVRRELYLVFKECLNNAVKHSGATGIVISIKVDGGQVQVGIADNGRGFEVESKLNGNHDGLGGNGLINMRRRVGTLAGTFGVRSAPSEGTTVTISVPVRRSSWLSARKAKLWRSPGS